MEQGDKKDMGRGVEATCTQTINLDFKTHEERLIAVDMQIEDVDKHLETAMETLKSATAKYMETTGRKEKLKVIAQLSRLMECTQRNLEGTLTTWGCACGECQDEDDSPNLPYSPTMGWEVADEVIVAITLLRSSDPAVRYGTVKALQQLMRSMLVISAYLPDEVAKVSYEGHSLAPNKITLDLPIKGMLTGPPPGVEDDWAELHAARAGEYVEVSLKPDVPDSLRQMVEMIGKLTGGKAP